MRRVISIYVLMLFVLAFVIISLFDLPKLQVENDIEEEINMGLSSRMEEMYLLETHNEEKSWELWAGQAFFYDRNKRAELKGVRFSLPIKRDAYFTLASQEGTIQGEEERFKFKGDVRGVYHPVDEVQRSESSETDPIEIHSDKLEGLKDENKATFIGNVKVSSSNYILHADRIIVKYSKEDKGIEYLEARDNVRLMDPSDEASYAKGDRAVYNKKDDIIVLTGHPLLIYKHSKIHGEKIIFDLKTKKSFVEGSADNQVKTIIFPER